MNFSLLPARFLPSLKFRLRGREENRRCPPRKLHRQIDLFQVIQASRPLRATLGFGQGR